MVASSQAGPHSTSQGCTSFSTQGDVHGLCMLLTAPCCNRKEVILVPWKRFRKSCFHVFP